MKKILGIFPLVFCGLVLADDLDEGLEALKQFEDGIFIDIEYSREYPMTVFFKVENSKWKNFDEKEDVIREFSDYAKWLYAESKITEDINQIEVFFVNQEGEILSKYNEDSGYYELIK